MKPAHPTPIGKPPEETVGTSQQRVLADVSDLDDRPSESAPAAHQPWRSQDRTLRNNGFMEPGVYLILLI